MLIQALCEYYDLKMEDDDSDIFTKQPVSFLIMLTQEGEIAQIVDIRVPHEIPQKKGKNGEEKTRTVYRPREIKLPRRSQKPGIDLNIIEHRPLYIFGLNYDKASGSFTPDDRTKKAEKSHDVFVQGNLDFCRGLSSDIAKAYCNFMERWKPGEQTENLHLLAIKREYSSYFAFALDGSPTTTLHDDQELLKKYLSLQSERDDEDEGAVRAVCPIEGEVLPVARIHNKIKGVLGANPTGGVLVGMKNSAFESYGKVQSYNSNISERAMKKYTAVLNSLLADQSHSRAIEGLTLVFFAMGKQDKEACGLFINAMMDGAGDKELNDSLESIAQEMRCGRAGDISALKVDENLMFYVVGLAPNSSRISQKFIIKNSFGKIMRNLIMHKNDFQVREGAGQLPLSWITKELISPKSRVDKVPSPLSAALMTAILNGTRYPDAMMEMAVRRVRTDSDEENNRFIKLNDNRAGIIKAYLNRKSRLANKKEDIKMSLDQTNINPAYLCGRLFAVLEHVQKESAKPNILNRTIKDSYFASACSKPATVLPKLVILSQNHLVKIERPFYLNRLIGEIIDGISGEFPQTLSLDDQGRFIIGYYHQNRDLYKKRNADEQKEEENQ